jgi:hypothetical protein
MENIRLKTQRDTGYELRNLDIPLFVVFIEKNM